MIARSRIEKESRHGKAGVLPEPLREQRKLLLRYRRTRSREVRDRLLEYYLPLVYAIARRTLISRSTSLDLDDMIGIGSLALFDSLERYDPHRGVAFPVFASHRIRGAILDEFRKLDDSKRSGLCPERSPAFPQAGQASTGGAGGVFRAARPRGRHLAWMKSHDALDRLVDPRGSGSIDDFERREVITFLTMTLSARERSILNLYYGRGITMREISKRLGLSAPRISALHTGILGRLQTRFKELKNEVFF